MVAASTSLIVIRHICSIGKRISFTFSTVLLSFVRISLAAWKWTAGERCFFKRSIKHIIWINNPISVLISSLESELEQAKNYLLEHFDLKDIEIFLIQESQIESIYNRIDQIASQYKIKGLFLDKKYTYHNIQWFHFQMFIN